MNFKKLLLFIEFPFAFLNILKTAQCRISFFISIIHFVSPLCCPPRQMDHLLPNPLPHRRAHNLPIKFVSVPSNLVYRN
jgi:hypothetical protein